MNRYFIVFFLIFYSCFPVLSKPKIQSTYDVEALLQSLTQAKDEEFLLKSLFYIGDERIAEIIRALDNRDENISLQAQRLIRYLGNAQGMNALFDWYRKKEKISILGPVPVPLSDWDYQYITVNYVEKPIYSWRGATSYIIALAIDNSPKAQAILAKLERGLNGEDQGYEGERVLRNMSESKKILDISGQGNLEEKIKKSLFFLQYKYTKYIEVKEIGATKKRDKMLFEVKEMGRFQSRYHIVIQRTKRDWRFFSVTLIDVS